MNDDRPLDLSALEPMREELRWRVLLADTMARVDVVLAERARREDPLDLIASWRRPLLVAAAAAVALLVPAELALERREVRTQRVERLVAISSQLAAADGQLSGADFVRALSAPAQPEEGPR